MAHFPAFGQVPKLNVVFGIERGEAAAVGAHDASGNPARVPLKCFSHRPLRDVGDLDFAAIAGDNDCLAVG